MNEFLLLKFAHLIAFVYWLGGDLGTFLASRQVINRELSPQARHTALRIMLACDMGPKLAMPLILPLGMHLAVLGGWASLPDWVLPVAWAAALLWFANVLLLYLHEGKPFTTRLAWFDFRFRILVVCLLVTWGAWALVGNAQQAGIGADWVAWKLLVFAAMVSCGIAIRMRLGPFVPAFADLMSNGPSEDNNGAMERSIGQCRPWVWCIWGGLFLNAAIGVHLVG